MSEKKMDVVISGISGSYPECDNIKELAEKLFNKSDLITDDDRRWKNIYKNIPHRSGKLKTINKFDSNFFNINPKLAEVMDPMGRMVLEKTFEAIIDSGTNPDKIRGSKTGVYIGAFINENVTLLSNDNEYEGNAYVIEGNVKCMIANRISHRFDLKGPSVALDSACSSSLYALDLAYRDIITGVCDAAIVGGTNLCLHPITTSWFKAAGMLSPDGKCKSFDESGNGYVRSEAICVVFLQKLQESHRVYAHIVHTKTIADGYKVEGIGHTSHYKQEELLQDFYKECSIKTDDVSWIEAHGTGTKVGDGSELIALGKVFGNKREDRLLIGSIKSNLGHSEASSGLCGVSKVIIAMEYGIIPPNINFDEPRAELISVSPTIQPVTDSIKWKGGLVGVNSFGFGGTNTHVLLRSNKYDKVKDKETMDIPFLVPVSGRTEEAVETVFSHLSSTEIDQDFIRLLHEIHTEEIKGHLHRGYILKEMNGKTIKHIEPTSSEKRPIWFVFSGMGSQWPKMAKDLMKLPLFASSIKKSHEILKPYGIDLTKLITEGEKEDLLNVVNCFVSIAAVQIALMDILLELEITPDGFVGHSVGELGCGYADGGLTAEQMLLFAYFRGTCTRDKNKIEGQMASIGLSHNELEKILPPEIDIACYNYEENTTISGPKNVVDPFVESLEANGTFARKVETANIAYHSRYIKAAVPFLVQATKMICQNPKYRSERWISTSFDINQWNSKEASECSGEYFAHNLANKVNFINGCKYIPSNAIVIEIAPHGLLQPILKKSLKDNVVNLSLMNRNHSDNLEFFLISLGRLFEAGLYPKIHKLYPMVNFPVSRGTAMISPLIKWDHTENMPIISPKFSCTGKREIKISLTDEKYRHLADHVIDGRNLLPASAYLNFTWETAALMDESIKYTETTVKFENVKFKRACIIPKHGSLNLTVDIERTTGKFVISEGMSTCVTGTVYLNTFNNHESIAGHQPNNYDMGHQDIYKELRLRGYNYGGCFKRLMKYDRANNSALIAWCGNYDSFIDNIFQLKVLSSNSRSLQIPTYFRELFIDGKKQTHTKKEIITNTSEGFIAYFDTNKQQLECAGVSLKDLKISPITRKRPKKEPLLETYEFVSFINIQECNSIEKVMKIYANVTTRNIPVQRFEIIEVVDQITESIVMKELLKAIDTIPLVKPEAVILSSIENITFEDNRVEIKQTNLPVNQSVNLVILHDTLNSKKPILKEAFQSIVYGGYVLTVEKSADREKLKEIVESELVLHMDYKIDDTKYLVLLRKIHKFVNIPTSIIKIKRNDYSWIKEIQEMMKNEEEKILIYSQENFTGIMGLYNSLKREYVNYNLRCLVIQDDKAPDLDTNYEFYKEITEMGYEISVLKQNVWGTYSHGILDNHRKTLTNYAYVNNITGDLCSLKWFEGPTDPDRFTRSDEDSSLIDVAYSPLNFRDVLLSTGKITLEALGCTDPCREYSRGYEYCGYGTNGKRYMGILDSGGMATRIVSDVDLRWEVPSNWSMEDASTIPLIYSTVLYALITKGAIHKGESILIHSGAGGIGQAAINVAIHYGCVVFTTVGNETKRKFIKETFPQIPDENIGNSRDLSFEDMIKSKTNNKGVDIVLNSLTEDKLEASLRCLGSGGRFLEIGIYDMIENNSMNMSYFLKECSFHGVRLDTFFNSSKDRKLEIKSLMQNGIDDGYVKPITRTVFQMNEIEKAFRFMSSGNHIGKVVIQIRNDNSPLLVEAIPKYLCYADRNYVICGGLGEIGLELVDWMVQRGTRNVFISSRQGIKNGYQASKMELWKTYGAKVVIWTGNITTEEGVRNLLLEAEKLAPVYAIFNLAAHVHDVSFSKQTEELFTVSAAPKALATYHLDQLSRKMCPLLQNFVVFSSIISTRGNSGQTSYGMANSVMDEICENRRANNLPALSIQWGPIGDVGIAWNLSDQNENRTIVGAKLQKLSSCLEALDDLLIQPNPIVTSTQLADKEMNKTDKTNNIVDDVLHVLGMKNKNNLVITTTLTEAGVDSMMIIEIQRVLESKHDLILTAKEIRDITFEQLSQLSLGEENTLKRNDNSETKLEKFRYPLYRLIGKQEDALKPFVDLSAPLLRSDKTFILLPGGEGTASVFDKFGTYLAPHRIYCFNYNHEKEYNDLNSISNMVYKTIKGWKKMEKFAIIGYSYGGLVAMEVMKMLENDGQVGQLWLIDSSPQFVLHLQSSLINDRDNIDQICITIFLIYLSDVNPEIKRKARQLSYTSKTWEEYLELIWCSLRKIDFRDKYFFNSFIVNTANRILNFLKNPTISPSKASSRFSLSTGWGIFHFVFGNVKYSSEFIISTMHIVSEVYIGIKHFFRCAKMVVTKLLVCTSVSMFKYKAIRLDFINLS